MSEAESAGQVWVLAWWISSEYIYRLHYCYITKFRQHSQPFLVNFNTVFWWWTSADTSHCLGAK